MIDANVITAFRQATISDKELKKTAMVRALQSSPEFHALVKEAGLVDWFARQALKRGGGSSAAWGKKRLLRTAAKEGRKANTAQRIAATEAGMSPAYIKRTAVAEGRKPVMDMKREIAKLESAAAKRFAGPSAMESLRMRIPGGGGIFSKLAPVARTGPGGPGLGKRNILGQYLEGAPLGRRGMIAKGMDFTTGVGTGIGRAADRLKKLRQRNNLKLDPADAAKVTGGGGIGYALN